MNKVLSTHETKASTALVPLNKNNEVAIMEEKAADFFSGDNFTSFYYYLTQGGWNDLSSYLALTYYRKVAPLFHGVDLVTDEVATIDPVIKEKSSQEILKEHQLLDLLNSPNPILSGSQFIKELTTYFKVTGNTFLVATGNPAREPLELFVIPPQDVTANIDKGDGYVDSYQVSAGGGTVTFNREEQDGRFRFISQDNMKEIFHLRTFTGGSSNNAGDCVFGMSDFTPMYYEIEQQLQASIHNLSLLRNGATPSGMLATDEELDKDVYERLQKELQAFYQGASNAGRPMIGEGGLTWIDMVMNNKDMDFLNLKKDSRAMIYNILGVPLALVTTDKMTLNNMGSAKLMLYDNAVIPTFCKIYDWLADSLMPRYGLDPDEAEISFIDDNIPALKERSIEQTLKLGQTGVLTINELRARMGYAAIDGDAGNQIFQPATMVPVGMDSDTDDLTEDDLRESNSKMFTQILLSKGYSEDEIENYLKNAAWL